MGSAKFLKKQVSSKIVSSLNSIMDFLNEGDRLCEQLDIVCLNPSGKYVASQETDRRQTHASNGQAHYSIFSRPPILHVDNSVLCIGKPQPR